MSGPLLTFDSGLGGISVFRHVSAALPRAHHIYVADDLAFPYGAMEAEELHDHCVQVLDGLIADLRPRLVTIACNTASTLVLETLRKRHDVPFVGTVPAVKPAAEQTRSGMISVLATPGTVARDYTHELIASFAPRCTVTLVGASRLAALAEHYAVTGMVDEEAVLEEIQPCFVKEQDGQRTDVIVLACTHFPLLNIVFEKLMPWPVRFIDPSVAIARRVVHLAGPIEEGSSSVRYLYMSGRPFPAIGKTLLVPSG